MSTYTSPWDGRNFWVVVCFEEMVEDPVEQVGNMLKFLRFQPYRYVFQSIFYSNAYSR